jgi:hypothetical protein
MQFLDVFTIVCTGLLVGNELAVSLFVNPVVWKLDDDAQMKALSLFARLLGRAMPVWYGLCLVLLIAEGYVRRDGWIMAAAIVWAATIVWTIAVLVPINNRIAALAGDASQTGWKQSHNRWDRLHRLRILLLVVAMVCLSYGIVRGG